MTWTENGIEWRRLCGGGVEGSSVHGVYTCIPVDVEGNEWKMSVRAADGAPPISESAAAYCYGVKKTVYRSEEAAKRAAVNEDKQLRFEAAGQARALSRGAGR